MLGERRHQQLQERLDEAYNVLDDYEKQLLTCDNPKKENELKREIETIKNRIRGFEHEVKEIEKTFTLDSGNEQIQNPQQSQLVSVSEDKQNGVRRSAKETRTVTKLENELQLLQNKLLQLNHENEFLSKKIQTTNYTVCSLLLFSFSLMLITFLLGVFGIKYFIFIDTTLSPPMFLIATLVLFVLLSMLSAKKPS